MPSTTTVDCSVTIFNGVKYYIITAHSRDLKILNTCLPISPIALEGICVEWSGVKLSPSERHDGHYDTGVCLCNGAVSIFSLSHSVFRLCVSIFFPYILYSAGT